MKRNGQKSDQLSLGVVEWLEITVTAIRSFSSLLLRSRRIFDSMAACTVGFTYTRSSLARIVEQSCSGAHMGALTCGTTPTEQYLSSEHSLNDDYNSNCNRSVKQSGQGVPPCACQLQPMMPEQMRLGTQLTLRLSTSDARNASE